VGERRTAVDRVVKIGGTENVKRKWKEITVKEGEVRRWREEEYRGGGNKIRGMRRKGSKKGRRENCMGRGRG
jgi:hypothetical protein